MKAKVRWTLVCYVGFVVAMVAGFVAWACLTHDPDDAITAWVTAGCQAALGGFCVFLGTGSRRY